MSAIDYAAAKFWWDAALTFIVLGNFIYTWIANRSNKNASAIGNMSNDIHLMNAKVRRIESDIEHLPGNHELGEVHEKINVVSGQVKLISGQLIAIDHTLHMLNEYLLKGGK